jgi:RHS repeat-associated protein
MRHLVRRYTRGLLLLAGALLAASCSGGSTGDSTGNSPPVTVTVPGVVGLTQASATSALAGAGLTLGAVTTASSATVPSGSVISQDPAAGASVAPASAVALVVSTGNPPPVTVTVPGVVGLTLAAATTAITGAGLTLGAVTTASSATVPAGNVISQDPAAGAAVAPGSAVALLVSTGPTTVVAPSVVGLTQAQAEASLIAAGLLVGAVTTAASATIPSGSVISQNPAAGAVVLALFPVDLVISSGPPSGGALPPDPATVASPIASGVATNLATSTSFLYQGPNPIQTGIAPGTIVPVRAAVLRGAVKTRDGAAIPGASVIVLGHPELGETLSRADGRYDMAVNGGGTLVVDVWVDGYLPSQRRVVVPWAQFTEVPDMVLVALDPVVTPVSSGAAFLQVARANLSTDARGPRQSTLLFAAGTTASLLLPNGTSVPAPVLHVRSTEYTVGPAGPDAMPGILPPTSVYTYAVENSADEAIAAGASHVTFSKPVVHYVENFLDFPAGTAVPVGWYDRSDGLWKAEDSGVVLSILGVTGGIADVVVDASGTAAGPAALLALGIDLEERQALGSLYVAGQSLWRVRTSHFSPMDLNWSGGPPADAVVPAVPTEQAPPVADPSEECGSVIGCETQTLGESFQIVGTPWRIHHQSDRTPGFRTDSHLEIPLSGAGIPPSLRRIVLEVRVAGRAFAWSHPASAGLAQPFDFDGKDVYGRDAWGAQPVNVRIGYAYSLTRMVTERFGMNGNGIVYSRDRASAEITLWQEYTTSVRSWSAAGNGLGGWALSVHHAYDPAGHRILYGDGRKREADALPPVVETTLAADVNYPYTAIIGGGSTGIRFTGNLAFGPDGMLYVATNRPSDMGGFSGLRDLTAFSLVNGPVNQVPDVRHPVIGPDGSVYAIASSLSGYGCAYNCVVRLAPDLSSGVAVAGRDAVPEYDRPGSGDGGPANLALIWPQALAVGRDGTIYFTESSSRYRVRRVGADGIISTIAGNGTMVNSGDGGLATAAGVAALGIAVGPDGSVYVADPFNFRVRRIWPSGTITTVAGNGTPGYTGDGGPATAANIQPSGIGVSPEGDLAIIQNWGRDPTGWFQAFRIRLVRADGTISTIAGGPGGTNAPAPSIGGSGGDGPALLAFLGAASDIPNLVWGPDRHIYVGSGKPADPGFGTGWANAIRRIRSAFPDGAATDILIPDEDGREVHVFSSAGRHLRTRDATTGAVLRSFAYDAAGFLSTVTDVSGNVTTVERSGSAPTAIVAPTGQRTRLSVDGAGWLSRIENPAGEAWTMTSAASGLLQGLVDPLGRSHSFAYDTTGRLVEDRGPDGAVTTLARTTVTGGHTVSTTSALGRSHRYTVARLPDGTVRRTVVNTSGATRTWSTAADGSTLATAEDGTTTSVNWGPDPRWGMSAPIPARTVITTPGGNVRTITASRTSTQANPDDPLSSTALVETVTEAGQAWSQAYAAATRTWTMTSPAGRVSTVQVDAQGRVVSRAQAGSAAESFAYDAQGRVVGRTEGARSTSFSYGTDGLMAGIVDPASRAYGYTRDLAGRVTGEALPGGRSVGLAHDAAGNVTALTPPGRGAHAFGRTASDLLAFVTPPSVGGPGAASTAYAWDADRNLTRIDLPDGDAVVLGYANPAGGVAGTDGRLTSMTSADGAIHYAWDSAGRLSTATADGVTFTPGYDGSLVTSRSWSGAVAGAIATTHDAQHRPVSILAGGVTAAYSYDPDGRINGAGDLLVTRDAATGHPVATALGAVTTTGAFSSYGELAGASASAGGTALYASTLTRDMLGRLTAVAETVQGVSRTLAYAYDAAGRLSSASVDGATVDYGYDAQGNRTSRTIGGVTESATFDAQDRLVSSGSTTYGWSATGALLSRAGPGGTTSFQHDAHGRLRTVVLPDGRQVQYLVDGLGRRVGKKVNGVLAEAFLYDGQFRPVAWLDGVGAVKGVFVYGPRGHAPEYIVSSAGTFRIVADHLGSPRLVVDAATGAVAQRLDYDAFGQVVLDSNPGLQPFGFAGGLLDRDTGLVHFGARDHDPATGRWTSKDPLGFDAGDTNLYAYAGNDPVNFIDPTGLAEVCAAKRNVKRGDTLFTKNRNVGVQRNSSPTSPLEDVLFDAGTPVTFRRTDPTNPNWIEVEVNGKAGVIYRENLSVRSNVVEGSGLQAHPSDGKPFDTQAFASSGCATKA